uniref:fimbrial biogenesis chaperone n=1 Tax=Microbulbifer agarilyticus TaxID=260552 RepID=UPI000255832B|nr:hypothetical protein [Microbulbifer agarilyticus]
MKKIITGAVFLLLTMPALAGMSLDKIIVYLDDSPNVREDIVVSNPDEETLYLKTEVYRVDNPGFEDEKRIRVVDPKEFKLLVSPAKAVIGSGESKRFRMMSLERDLTKEKVYRVTFRPVVGDIESDRTAVKILVAYQALIFVQPQNGKYQLEVTRQGDRWSLKNNGNINVEVSNVQYCPDALNCQKLNVGGRLYAGNTVSLDVPMQGGELVLLAQGREAEQIRLPIPVSQ